MSTLFIGPTRLGDAILTTGLLGWLAETYPEDPITVACGAPASLALRGAAGVETLHVMRKRRASGHWVDLWRQVRGRRWRRVVDLRRSMLPWLLRADERFTLPRSQPGEHRVSLAARTLGLPPLAPRAWVSDAHRAAADGLLPVGLPVLALGVGTNWAYKTWPAERFAALAQRFLGAGGDLAGGGLLLVGGKEERREAGVVMAALPGVRIVDALGVDIPTSAALLQRSSLFVGNDSAMMHLAVAAGTRTVGLFGPTRDDHYGPWGERGLVVRTPASTAALVAELRRDGTERTLMGGLTVDAVAHAIAGRWKGLAAPGAQA